MNLKKINLKSINLVHEANTLQCKTLPAVRELTLGRQHISSNVEWKTLPTVTTSSGSPFSGEKVGFNKI
jgi:hypothetical protein